MNPSSVTSRRVSGSRAFLLHPSAPAWLHTPLSVIHLLPTPLGRQPSEYLKYTQDPQKVGKVTKVSVATVHNGEDIFFRLTWDDPTDDAVSEERDPFVDATGVIMPFRSDAPHTIMVTMGSEAYKVNVWYWRADEPGRPRNVWAQGLGTTVTSKESHIFSQAHWTHTAWNVIMGRAMKLPGQKDEAVQLSPGMKTLVSFAVWEGSNKERGGIKAFCPCKTDLMIEP